MRSVDPIHKNTYGRLINPSEQINIGPISTSRTEIIDIIKAWVAISFAFALLMEGGVFNLQFITFFMVASLSVGAGFIAHELSHKLVAQRYGCQAEFRSWDQMLILAVIMAFVGFIIAAPGAVMISGPVGVRRNGKISAAGSIANLLVAAIFLVILLLGPGGVLLLIAKYGLYINSWLALFNMIPFAMFDGKKVIEWSKTVYFSIVGISLAFVVLSGLI